MSSIRSSAAHLTTETLKAVVDSKFNYENSSGIWMMIKKIMKRQRRYSIISKMIK